MDYEICYNEKLGEYGPDSKEIEHKIMGKEKVGGSWIRLEPVSLTLALDFCDDAHLHKSEFCAVIIEFFLNQRTTTNDIKSNMLSLN